MCIVAMGTTMSGTPIPQAHRSGKAFPGRGSAGLAIGQCVQTAASSSRVYVMKLLPYRDQLLRLANPSLYAVGNKQAEVLGGGGS